MCAFALADNAPKHSLRILAVGDQPPFIQEVRNGVRYELPPPPEAIPPRSVTIPVAPPKGAEKSEIPDLQMRLRLGQPSAPLLLPLPESGKVELKTEGGAPWLGIPLDSSNSSLALVWRGGPDWTKAGTIVVPDDTSARTEGNVHFTNVSPFAVGVSIGKEKIRLNPGVTFTRRVSGPAAIPLEISYFTASGGTVLCHSASLEPSRGVFRRVVVYKADSKAPRNPVKVLQLDESSSSPESVATASTR